MVVARGKFLDFEPSEKMGHSKLEVRSTRREYYNNNIMSISF